jgi:hypothetical protein
MEVGSNQEKIQSPYSSINSRTPSMVLAARGSKITLNGRGWAFADSVKAKSSIGAERSGLMLNAHWISAVLRKTDLLNGLSGNETFEKDACFTHAVAMYCPGHTLQRNVRN